MARKAPGSRATPQPVDPPVAPVGAEMDPATVTFEVDLPPDLAAAPPPPEPEPPAPDEPPSVAIPAVPPGAPRPLLADLTAAREEYRQALARVAPGPGAVRPDYAYEYQIPADHDYDKEPDLRTVFTKAGKHLGTTVGQQVLKQARAEFGAELATLRQQMEIKNLVRSDLQWTRLVPDYKERILKSGLDKMIALDPTTGRPKYPDQFDPVFYQRLLTHPDPGQYAYDLAAELLAGTAPAAPAPPSGPSRPEALRARLDVAAVERAATRPTGIHAMPAAAGARRTISFDDIKGMSDAEQAWIMDNRPDIWAAYKKRAFGL